MKQHVPPKRMRRKAIKVSHEFALVEKAQAHGINLSQLLDHRLREAVRAAEE